VKRSISLHDTAQFGIEIEHQRLSADLRCASRSESDKAVMLDFYADWCVSCKEMERFTFSDPQVRVRLAGMTLLRADVTANSAEDKALLKRYRLFGPRDRVLRCGWPRSRGPARHRLPASREIHPARFDLALRV